MPQLQIAPLKNQPLAPDLLQQLQQAVALKKWPLAKLISLFENKNPDAAQIRHDIARHIQQHPQDFPRERIEKLGTIGPDVLPCAEFVVEVRIVRSDVFAAIHAIVMRPIARRDE